MQRLLPPNPSFRITKTVKESNYLLLTTSPKISLCDQYVLVFFSTHLKRWNRIAKKENNTTDREPTDLRCHTMTEVHDGNIVSVRSLVQTQVVSEAVLQLEKTKQADKRQNWWKTGKWTWKSDLMYFFNSTDKTWKEKGRGGQHCPLMTRNAGPREKQLYTYHQL